VYYKMSLIYKELGNSAEEYAYSLKVCQFEELFQENSI